MITVIDYGSGNLRSISNSFSHINVESTITNDPEEVAEAEYLVLPGVGAFGQIMKSIEPYKKVIKEHVDDGKPFLGVCLGLQALLSSSEEAPGVKGLSIFKGEVKKLPNDNRMLKMPHMGWNRLDMTLCEPKKTCAIIDGIVQDYFYFVHSYYAAPDDEEVIAGTVKYGFDVTAVLHENNVYATQFHPEKSGVSGLKMLKNFVTMSI
ncbi:Imidazole glycerol phosphate synthase subunit HisH [Candidatus Methanobinarius endosymbioticus]|uniref:Imidazole glycerol phosphate synthase subunit HisH n=1 Tax=Candidatus Methanobinarius endosymbioticus TaxID=2006182 RepID=A0A366MBS2_9EURY|nr:Imidazole glycerol phosphate synthase subunit HisH [Candidatus Methanobinarius endosymbioticus]